VSSERDLLPYGPKPKLRGVFHQWAAAGFAIAAPVLLAGVRDPIAWRGTATFLYGLVALFTISALYHRVEWSPRALGRMRRLDHAGIFGLIACVYTPFCLMALPPADGRFLLAVAWIAAAVGVGRVLLWPYAPKPVAVATYCLHPLLAAPYLERIYAGTGPTGTAAMVLGNTVVALGALAYAYERPDPVPGVFGPHEIFHVTVVACAVAYSVAVVGLARTFG
jgi:hemolysin III